MLFKSRQKRKLEKVVIHKTQFKGHSRYYQSSKRMNLNELMDLLNEMEHKEEVELTVGEKVASLLDDDELEMLLDRSQSYQGGKQFALMEEDKGESTI